jgi:hypothetical protein
MQAEPLLDEWGNRLLENGANVRDVEAQRIVERADQKKLNYDNLIDEKAVAAPSSSSVGGYSKALYVEARRRYVEVNAERKRVETQYVLVLRSITTVL